VAATRGLSDAPKPDTLPLWQIFPDQRSGSAGANNALEEFGELKGAKVEVELSDFAPAAPTQGHARMEALQRSLQIRKGLQDSGVEPGKIVVKMPEKFMLEGETPSSQGPQDQLTIIKPEK
jgi:hypothetical protein